LNVIDVEENSYRGSIVISNEKKNYFSIVNSVDVEEYLRGVVPLEIGKLGNDAIEALKSQAIAARTYTYQRIREQVLNYFDLYSTTADQVYGGANVEYREADLAVRLTKNLVLVYNDSIARAYYHSTCGGRTANIEDVWSNKPYLPYLRTESDSDSSGIVYCRGSKQFKWEETWTREKFSQYVDKGLKVLNPNRDFRGLVKDIRITSKFDCGRIRTCRISADKWTYECGGDVIRSVFRRPLAGDPILRSAKFTVTNGPGGVRISGTGYGHGVGMCQYGAIARAKCGQTFDTILKAYYRGIVICTAAYP
jgi:stage II sporulation protein D